MEYIDRTAGSIPSQRELEMKHILKIAVVASLVTGLVSVGNAQWLGSSIHPAGKDFSAAYGAGQGVAVGNSGGALSQAGYWTNGGNVYHTLHQAQWIDSIAFAGDENMQVGGYLGGPSGHAARWSGTAASIVDMNPDRYNYSTAYAMFGTKMAGVGTIQGVSGNRALLWNSGDRNDYVDLTPDQASSGVFAITATNQVGYSDNHAALWSGTAASIVDLNPQGMDASSASAAFDDRQGGRADSYIDGTSHAYLWSGTAISGIDLHPVGVTSSNIQGMSASFQVGMTYDDSSNRTHAAIWSGTTESYVDLHDFLPGFTNSEATSIVEYADHVEVYGFAYVGGLGGERNAVMWTQTVPEPGSMIALGIGLLGIYRLRRRR